ncbi:MAG: chitobiase/beta-hexosaminidase C-terminal domain-containing protein [Bacteroidales bacterium]|nr:chitobiase/beta-hexosaminidase C-terminal domain-containing protein [Bacteroidales bacterium]
MRLEKGHRSDRKGGCTASCRRPLLHLAALALLLFLPSALRAQSLSGSGTAVDPYLIEDADDYGTFVTNVNTNANDDATKYYKITGDINVSGAAEITQAFSGTLTAEINPTTKMPYRIKNLSVPLFSTLTGTVKNLVLENVTISQSGQVGAVARVANGTARIYNVGILSGSIGSTGAATDSPKSANACGGLVGLLAGTARVVNCYSYATITGGNRVGGIVGYNDATTTAGSINTMVMNCMFYGDITAGNKVSPVYGGTNIDNLNSGGLNTFNYYAYDKLKTKSIDFYNCALAADEKYLTRFEFYRLLLNSNKKLAAYYVTGDKDDANLMLKWVLDKNVAPYPVLKQQGTYPSIVNISTTGLADYDEAHRNQGRKIGTLAVTISESNTTAGGQTKPTYATVTTTSLTLVRTDKDTANFNFNYDKVQLPYYNDVGTKNYTGNKVVTGWKITGITTLADDPYTNANYDYSKTYASNPEYFDAPNYNFADRKSSQKDLYSVSGRVFSQGAYFDVPYGVTSITIEPYWGKAAYVSDEYLDVVYNTSYAAQSVTQLGRVYGSNGTNVTINGSSQPVYTSISNALSNLSGIGSPTVYDYAVVLVGNLHQGSAPSGGTKPFTMMSVDLDNDHEPDYSMIYHHNSRAALAPMRFDFLNIPGTAHAQKPNGTGTILNAAIFRTKGWFEITNTSFIYFTQYEYENTGTSNDPNNITKTSAPLILLGGYIDQFVSAQSAPLQGKTIYIHVGGNVFINSFGLGTHSDGSGVTQHVPVSVTGGEYNGFYLSGTYNQNATPCDDNAECYISGGRFGELAGAAQEQIGSTNSATKGNVTWQIYNADITDFYGGGVNDAKPVQGSITTDIINSHVASFCGGPKFGNMASGKTVTTTAEGCTFDKFFGAGFGGNSYSRKKYFDAQSYNFSNLQKYYYNPGSNTQHENERGKYYDGVTTNAVSSQYGKKGPGVATDFDYELFVWTSGKTGARFFIKFVSFSLAQCNNVSSTLTHCTITDNFYGGGSLGKVNGTAISTLDSCTVAGHVFGAGYSATLPTVPVRSGGFLNAQSFPTINTNSGMFEDGVMSDTVHYHWKHVDSYPANGTQTFTGSNDSIITTTDISKSNLGSVGAVILTLKGNTTVGGSVFGGGEESKVAGGIEVTLQDDVEVTGSVFGGGNLGVVESSTNVTIGGGSVGHSVYGGGNQAGVGGSDVTLAGGSVLEGIYGGCNSSGTVTGNIAVNINGGTLGVLGTPLTSGIFGGGYGEATRTNGNVTVSIGTEDLTKSPTIYSDIYGGSALGQVNDDAADLTTVNFYNGTLHGNVYGGGLGQAGAGNVTKGQVNGTVNVNIGTAAQTGGNDVVLDGMVFGCNNTNGSPQADVNVDVYHTGHTANTNDFAALMAMVEGTDTIADLRAVAALIETPATEATGNAMFALKAVYGGGNEADYVPAENKKSTVTIHGCTENTIKYVYGGGRAASSHETHVVIEGGHIYQAFAGGDGSNGIVGANVGYMPDGTTPCSSGTGNTEIVIHGGAVYQAFGGSNMLGKIRGATSVDLIRTCSQMNIVEAFGGNNRAASTGDRTVTINCGTEWNDVYGGSNEADITGNVTLNILGGKMRRAFGGSKNADIDGNVTVNVYGGSIGDLYGGNNVGGDITGTITVNVDIDPDYTCADGPSLTNVYGGGKDAAYTPTDCFHFSPVVNIMNNRYQPAEGDSLFAGIENVYGGGYGTTAQTVSYPRVIVGGFGANKRARVYNNVYGGGYGAPVHGNTTTLVRGSSIIGRDDETSGMVFGGGYGTTAVIHGETYVGIFGTSEVKQNVYGGGNAGAVLGNTDVQIGYIEQVLPVEIHAVKEDETVYATLICATPDVNIRYNKNGTDPTTESGTVYSTRFAFTWGDVIKAIAYKEGMMPSVVSFDLSPEPTIEIDGSTVTLNAFVGARIYYTKDGTEPTTSSTLYGTVGEADGTPFTVTTGEVVKAMAVMRGCVNSEVGYLQAEPPTITFDGDDCTISSPTGTRIIYTTDGSNPSSTMGGGSAHGIPAGTNSVTINDVADGTTVKAIVEHDGYMPSNIRAVKYTATP